MRRQDASLSHQAAGSAGFTVAEFVAAAAILFIILVGVLGAVEYAGASTRMAAMRQSAVNVATAQIEKSRNLPWEDIGVTYDGGFVGNPPGTIPAFKTVTTSLGTFWVETEVWWATDDSLGTPRPAHKKMRVTVSWTKPTAGRLAVETAVFGQGESGNTGDVKITAVEADDPTKVVPGVSIIIDPTGAGATSVARTGSDGVAFFGGIKPVPNPMPVSITGTSTTWLVDTTGLSPMTITTGFQNLGFVYCQQACTAIIHVRSDGVENLAGASVTLTDKDRPSLPPVTLTTDADGNATFTGLWVSKGSGYQVVATYGSQTSSPGTFSLTSSGQVFSGLTLTVTEPPSITIRKVVAGTGTTITGRQWRVRLLNPSGTQILDTTTTQDSVTKPITVGGNYTAIVTGVTGFSDNAGFVFSAAASGAGQDCAVPMSPYFLVRVLENGAPGIQGGRVTVTKVGGGPTIQTVAGTNPPGITDANGEIGFRVLTNGQYDVAAVVNGVTYNGPRTSVDVASPQPYDMNVTLGHLIVRVKRVNSSSWKRYVGLYDSYGNFVAAVQATRSYYNLDFYVPGGAYTVVVCGSDASANRLPMPATLAAVVEAPSRFVKYPIPTPVPTNGGTVYAPSSSTQYLEP